MKRSLLVQTLLDMATGDGGAKLEALVVDAAGTFDAGSGKGYNPVTVPSGTVTAVGEKSAVSNNSVVVTPKAQVVGGWLNSGETSGSGVGVTASELVSGTLNVSSDGVQDVTNYQNISVPSGGHAATAHKSAVSNNSVTVTPRSTATRGFVQEGTVEGIGVEVSASELVSGNLNIDTDGVYDVTNYKNVTVSAGEVRTLVTSKTGSINATSTTYYENLFALPLPIDVKRLEMDVTIKFTTAPTTQGHIWCAKDRTSYASTYPQTVDWLGFDLQVESNAGTATYSFTTAARPNPGALAFDNGHLRRYFGNSPWQQLISADSANTINIGVTYSYNFTYDIKIYAVR